jgi:hypothetical protein
MMKRFLVLAVIAAASFVLAQNAEARPKSATCFVTGVGNYACTFTPIGGDGSFRITARGRDTYMLTLNGDDTAYAFLQIRGRGRNIALPGVYVRDYADRACWASSDPAFRICAR